MWNLALMNLGQTPVINPFKTEKQAQAPKYIMSEAQRRNVERNHERARIKGELIMKQVTAYIRKHKIVNSVEAAKKMGIGASTVVNKLKELERDGKVRKIGAGNRVKWEYVE